MGEKELLKKLQMDNHKILIYGAGMVGSLVFHGLLAGGILVDIIAFVVSHKEKENAAFLEREIYDIHACKSLFENVHIIISTLLGAHHGIIHTLHEIGYYEFDVVDDMLFKDMEKLYVTKYNSEHSITDILGVE